MARRRRRPRRRATVRWARRRGVRLGFGVGLSVAALSRLALLVLRIARSRRRLAGPLLGLAVFGLGLGIASCVTSPPPPPDERDLAALPGEPVLRVLLVEGAAEVKLALASPGSLAPSRGQPALVAGLDAGPVRATAGGLTVGDRAFPGATELRIVAERSGGTQVNGQSYRGEIVLLATPLGVRVVNHVRLEDYLEGVIGREMPLSWHDEALRAQAIAARSYAIWHYKHGASARDHDVKNDQRSQVYGGVEPTGKARAVVRATEGRVVAWDGRLFEAFFHSTCGGETVPAAWNLGAPDIAPLAGAACGKCDGSKHAKWKREVAPAELEKALKPHGVEPPIARVETLAFPRGGYVKDVLVAHKLGETRVSAKAFRTALGLKSTCFEVASKDGLTLVVEGKGWGHGVGLCQTGAKGFAEAGLTGEAILGRYYPGASVQKLY